ncbi:hypothetical protein HI113_44115 [Corallococcus exiguus]|nr:hypothetical protein [Corallococcus exiguus]
MAPRTIAVSGNQSIDGLLAGVGWDVSALTFSFPTHPSLYDDDGDPTNINSYGPENTIAHNFQPADGACSAQTDQKIAVAYALGLIELYRSVVPGNYGNDDEPWQYPFRADRFLRHRRRVFSHGYLQERRHLDESQWRPDVHGSPRRQLGVGDDSP